jgi:hypothetical protein
MEPTLKEATDIMQVYLDHNLKYEDQKTIDACQTLIDHAKKCIEPLEGEAFVGREVQYLGQYFTVIKYSNINNDYLIDNGRLRIWVKREKFRVID